MGSTPINASCKSQSTSTTTCQQKHFKIPLSESDFVWFLNDFARSVFSGVATNKKVEWKKFDGLLLRLSNQKWAKLKNRKFLIRIYNQLIETYSFTLIIVSGVVWSVKQWNTFTHSSLNVQRGVTTLFKFSTIKHSEKTNQIPLLQRNNSPPARSTEEPETQRWTDKSDNVREESTDARVEAQATSIIMQQLGEIKNRLIRKNLDTGSVKLGKIR